MATRYIQQATKQLNPGYTQQINALQGQVPAIQNLYQTLVQGLQGQQQVGNQNILEGASDRGLLYSTIPVEQQAGLGQQILQQQGQYAAQQAKDLGGIQSQIAGIQTDRAGAIAQLANTLRQLALNQQQFNYQKQQSARDYYLQKQTANQQYRLGLKAARL